MKIAALALIGLVSITSVCFAWEEDHYKCINSNKTIQLFIDGVNRPDLEIDSYDSADASNKDEFGEIKSKLLIDNKIVKRRIRGISVNNSQVTSIATVSPSGDGKMCTTGATDIGLKYRVKITVSGKASAVDLICAHISVLPQGAIECE